MAQQLWANPIAQHRKGWEGHKYNLYTVSTKESVEKSFYLWELYPPKFIVPDIQVGKT